MMTMRRLRKSRTKGVNRVSSGSQGMLFIAKQSRDPFQITSKRGRAVFEGDSR